MRKLSWFLFVLFFLKGSLSWSATYYVDSAGGKDSNKGTEPASPWKTIEKVNAYEFRPGDRLLFKRGETFHGHLKLHPKSEGEEKAPITLGAYGEGPLPLLTSKRTLGTFQSIGANRWGIPLEGRSRNTRVAIARRRSDGFVFRNLKDSVDEIRSKGDFFHDTNPRSPSLHRFYVYSEKDPSRDIEVPTASVLYLAGNSRIDVEYLHFDFSNMHAIQTMSPASHLTFRHIEVTNTGKAAHTTSGKLIRYVTFDHVLFHHNNGHGIQINGKGKYRDFWTITNSEFHHNCLDTHDDNRAVQTNAYCAAIKGITEDGSGDNWIVEHNHVHHNGNVEQNNPRINKGVGIWVDTWEPGQATVRHNTVHDNILAGIELELTTKQTVEGNLVYRNGQGAPHVDFMNGQCGITVNRGSHGNIVRHNTVFHNNGFQLCLVGPIRSGKFSNFNVVTDNVFIPLDASQGCLLVHGKRLQDFDGNEIDANNCGPPHENFIRWGVNPGPSNNPKKITGYHSYADWTAQYRKDTGMTASRMREKAFTIPPVESRKSSSSESQETWPKKP